MSCLHYRDNALYLEEASLISIAEQFGTPTYVYSKATIEKNWHAFDQAFNNVSHLICYSVKANSNIAILKLLVGLNSGFDIVSVGELARILRAGGNPKKTVFSGVGKTQDELKNALEKDIFCINIESIAELERLHTLCLQMQKQINISLRINPNVSARTHAHITTGLKENKFGIDLTEIAGLSQRICAMKHIRLIGIACHIGSQLLELDPFLQAFDHMLLVYDQLSRVGIQLEHINIGGGLGIAYHHEQPPAIEAYAKALQKKIAGLPLTIIIEPGRAIVGNAGILLTRIEYLKHTHHKNFAIVDAGMNDLLRPALYSAWQDVLPVQKRSGAKKPYDIAGPVCESADFIGKNRELALEPNDLLAVDKAGAYGFVMSSNYNSRCRSAEVLVDKNKVHLIRRRETIHELFALETIPNELL